MAAEPGLPDLLAPGLRVISIGLNPSPISAATGVYFANPRNRFWPALRAAGLIPAGMQASPAAMRYLIDVRGIGFTDVVKRVTPGVAQLRAADYRRDAPRLLTLLHELLPEVAWFHGKVAYQNFLRHGLGLKCDSPWGWQPPLEAAAADPPADGCPPWPGRLRVFVSPNPSPANAAYSLKTLAEWYRQLLPVLE